MTWFHLVSFVIKASKLVFLELASVGCIIPEWTTCVCKEK
jgi:hypothetical protein